MWENGPKNGDGFMKLVFLLCLFFVQVHGTYTLNTVTDPNLPGPGDPNAVSGNSSDFFIVNNAPIQGSNGVVGWYYPPGSSTAMEIKDSGFISEEALPTDIAVNSNGDFFITNSVSVLSGPTLIGWYYPAGATSPVEVIDSNLSSLSFAIQVAANDEGNFVILNGVSLSGTNKLIGWYYSPETSIISEILDPGTLSGDRPYALAADGANFFIVNHKITTGTSALIGWYYAPGTSSITEVSDTLFPVGATPGNIAVNDSGAFVVVNNTTVERPPALIGWSYASGTLTEIEDGSLAVSATPGAISSSGDSFFIGNVLSLSGANNLVGWYCTAASSVATEVLDPATLSSSANVFSIASNSNGDFFITNHLEISGMNALIGWHYNHSVNAAEVGEVFDANTSAPAAVPSVVAANSAGHFFILNSAGTNANTGIIGWNYVPTSSISSSTASEVIASGAPLNTIIPASVFSNGSGNFFITNYYGDNYLTGSNGLIGWYYIDEASTASQVLDPDLLQFATPGSVSNNRGDFFIVNAKGSIGTNSLIGWYFNGITSTLTEIVDPNSITSPFHSTALASNANGDFFILNGSSFISEGILGWYYTPGSSTALEVQASAGSSGTAQPNAVAANSQGNFFISKNTASTSVPLIGWYYIPGETSASEVLDSDLMGNARPANICANGSSFFIQNSETISSGYPLLGWSFTPGSSIMEVLDSGLSGSARPGPVAANGGNVFITNNISLSGVDQLIGWYYTPTSITEIKDSSTLSSATPSSVGVNERGAYFISNSSSLTTSGSLVGWYFAPGSSILEVTDPDVPMNGGRPGFVCANATGNFFIVSHSVSAGIGCTTGWYYTPGSATALQIDDFAAPLNSFPNLVVANPAGDFFISNFSSFSGGNGVIGWYYMPGSSVPIEVIANPGPQPGVPDGLAVNSYGDFFISFSSTSETSLFGGPIIGWYYNSPISSRAFKRPNNRR
jgi:hypothetical protein